MTLRQILDASIEDLTAVANEVESGLIQRLASIAQGSPYHGGRAHHGRVPDPTASNAVHPGSDEVAARAAMRRFGQIVNDVKHLTSELHSIACEFQIPSVEVCRDCGGEIQRRGSGVPYYKDRCRACGVAEKQGRAS